MKIGIIGAGTILPDFLDAVEEIPQITVKSIYGLDSEKERMHQLADSHRVERVYTDYGAILHDNIDTVYIAVPNHLHFIMARKALENGINVILEKPFTSNKKQAEELFRLAAKKQLFIFEAIPNIYTPNYLLTQKLIEDLGQIRIITINYSQYSRRYDAFKAGNILPVFNPKMAGGSLMDLGVYNIHLITGLFGKPLSTQYYANVINNIDVSGILVFRYAGFLAVLISAKDCKAPPSISIQGDLACIYSNSPPNFYESFEVMHIKGEIQEYNENNGKPRLYHELKKFLDVMEDSDYSFMNKMKEQTFTTMEILDISRKQVGIQIPN